MASAVVLNTVQIYPSDIVMSLVKIGKVQVSANGARTFLHRTTGGTPIFKRQWDLSFQGITEARRNTLRLLVLQAVSVVFIDQFAVSYTVNIAEEEPFEESVAIIGAPNALNLYYNCKMKLFEA